MGTRSARVASMKPIDKLIVSSRNVGEREPRIFGIRERGEMD